MKSTKLFATAPGILKVAILLTLVAAMTACGDDLPEQSIIDDVPVYQPFPDQAPHTFEHAPSEVPDIPLLDGSTGVATRVAFTDSKVERYTIIEDDCTGDGYTISLIGGRDAGLVLIENLGNIPGLMASAAVQSRFLTVPVQKQAAGGEVMYVAGFAEVAPDAINWYYYQIWFIDGRTGQTTTSIYCKAKGKRTR
ncbi:MAG: hypothetical protein R3301_11245 [Saprospiraceae bacterium]|nr:hypothetical protein [Saprospiraceae bacterium]